MPVIIATPPIGAAVIRSVIRTVVAVIVRRRWRDVAGRRAANNSARRRPARSARRGECGRDDIAVLALIADLAPAGIAAAHVDR